MRTLSTSVSEPNDNPKPSPILLLLVPMVTVMLIYGYLLFLCIKSMTKIKRNPQATSFGKTFYFMVFLVPLSRIVSFVIMGLEMLSYTKDDKHEASEFVGFLFITLNYLPDLFTVLSFSIYGWLVLLIFLMGLVHLPHPNLTSPNLRNGFFITWLVFLIGIELAQIVGCLNYWLNNANFTIASYVLLNSITSLVTAGFVIATEIVLHFVFSGIPFKADFHQKRFIRVNRILFYWGMACAFKGVINILQKDTIEALWRASIKDVTTLDSVVPPLLLVLQLFFVEIVPLQLVNDSKICNYLFIKSENNNGSALIIAPSPNSGLTENLISQESNSSPQKDDVVYYQGNSRPVSLKPKERKTLGAPLIINSKDVILGDKEEEQKELLGDFYTGRHKGEVLKVRVIRLKKLTTYLTEEIKRENARFTQFVCPNLLQIRGSFCQDPEITLYYEYVEQISLHNLLYKRTENFQAPSHISKLNIALQIATALKYLHSQEPSVIHGYLNPWNIFVDRDGQVKVTDYGLSNLKKYANITGLYNAINQYTAPEIYKDQGKMTTPENSSVDVYSFGIILWELITEKVPFEGLDTHELHKIVCEDNSRPKIPTETGEELQALIRACWQQEPSKRPKLNQIIEILKEEIE